MTATAVGLLWRLSTLDSRGAKAAAESVKPLLGRELASVLRGVLLDTEWEAGLVRKGLVVALGLLVASRLLRYAFLLVTCRICAYREAPLLSLFRPLFPAAFTDSADAEFESEAAPTTTAAAAPAAPPSDTAARARRAKALWPHAQSAQS